MKVTVQFYGGYNYSAPMGTDIEHFDSVKEAKDSLWRRSDFDPYYPCVTDNAEMIGFFGHMDDVTDVYPDFRLFIGPKGGIRKEIC